MASATNGEQTAGSANDMTKVENELRECYDSHPEVLKLRSVPDSTVELRTVIQVDGDYAKEHYTTAVLAGQDRIDVKPFVIIDNVEGRLVAFYQFGRELSGHRGILHGGVAMTLLDECLGRASLAKLPKHTAVTGSIEVKFFRPVALQKIVYVKAETESIDGRKAFMKGSLHDAATGDVCVEATGLYVQPKEVEGFETKLSEPAFKYMK